MRSTVDPSFEPARRDAVISGERRQATVLFCDLVDSTGLERTVGSEAYGPVLVQYRKTVKRVVERFEGQLDLEKHEGDGLLAFFGLPVAHEDDAQHAVRAGLSIVKAVESLEPGLRRAHGVRLIAKVGIDTGQIVLREFEDGYQTVGMLLPRAKRLQDVAEAEHAVIISGSTERLVKGYFLVENIGLRELKGIGPVTSLYRVIEERVARNRLDAVGKAALTPLVGRSSEIQKLRSKWKEVTESRARGQVVLVCGDPGIGKSRLVRALEEDVVTDPRNWLTVLQASPYFQNSAFFPVGDFLEHHVLQFEPGDDVAQKRRKLDGWLAEYGPGRLRSSDIRPDSELLSEARSLFARLLSLPVDMDASSKTEPVPQSDPSKEKQKIKDMLLQTLLSIAAERPVFFVCEDLHWADPSTLELLDLVVQNIREASILAVFTFRSNFKPPWMTSNYVTDLPLKPLGHDAAAQIAAVATGGVALSRRVLEQILSTAEGNPLFLEELAKAVLELRLTGSNLAFAPVGAPAALKVPTTLSDSLTARLDRLGRPAKQIAQLASAIGREFSYELLRAVWQTYRKTSERQDGRDVNENELRRAINQLIESALIYQSGLPRGSRYEFKHALVQKAAYDAMLESERPKLHERIAEQLLARLPDLAHQRPELVAHHLTEAGLSERAIPYLQQAGQRALERAANVEAIAHLELGLKLLKALPASPRKDQIELDIQFGLSPAYMAIKGWASLEVERTCRRGWELGELCGNLRARYGFLWGLWSNLFLRGRLQEAFEAGRQVMDLAVSVPIPDSEGSARQVARNLRVMAHHALGYSHFYRGEFRHALDHAEAGLALQATGKQCEFNLEGERDIVRDFQFSSSAALLIMKGCSRWMLGATDGGLRDVEAAITLTRELKHRPSEAYALSASLLLHHYRLDVERTAETAEQLLALAREEDFEIYGPVALIFRGWALTESGREAEGIAETRLGLQRWQNTGSSLNQTIVIAMLARSLRRADFLDEAIRELDAEIIKASERTEFHFAPELHRLKGEILHDQGMRAASEACLEQAIDMARAQNARMLELRATVSLGRILAQTGRHDVARRRVQSVYHAFAEAIPTPDLRDAEVLLKKLDQPTKARRKGVGSVPLT